MQLDDPQQKVLLKAYEALRQSIPGEHLSIGGGTVLAARWNHRVSTDLDLFCDPHTYLQLGQKGYANLDNRLRRVEGIDTDRSWCEDVAIYCVIDGIELTLLPREMAVDGPEYDQVEPIGLRAHGTAAILYGKIANRMGMTGEAAIRDLYDAVRAEEINPAALSRTIAAISPQRRKDIAAMIRQLPPGWSEQDAKPLVQPDRAWTEVELGEAFCKILEAPKALRQERRKPQTG